jgi:hypothetical protein
MLATVLCLSATFCPAPADDMPLVRVVEDKEAFVLDPSGKAFTPWGFKYDHDTEGRLIEDYWEKEWDKPAASEGDWPGRGRKGEVSWFRVWQT